MRGMTVGAWSVALGRGQSRRARKQSSNPCRAAIMGERFKCGSDEGTELEPIKDATAGSSKLSPRKAFPWKRCDEGGEQLPQAVVSLPSQEYARRG